MRREVSGEVSGVVSGVVAVRDVVAASGLRTPLFGCLLERHRLRDGDIVQQGQN